LTRMPRIDTDSNALKAPRKLARRWLVAPKPCEGGCEPAPGNAPQNNPPSPRRTRRVALLGIAQRRISIKFNPKTRNEIHAKPLPESIKTIADWIQVKRHEKNLTHGQLAAKMGIATALVQSWESGTSQPNKSQMTVLANLLGCDVDFDPTKEDAFAAPIFPREPGKEPAACHPEIEAQSV